VAKNLSKNGFGVKKGAYYEELIECDETVELSSPTVFNVRGFLLYFQIFFVVDDQTANALKISLQEEPPLSLMDETFTTGTQLDLTEEISGTIHNNEQEQKEPFEDMHYLQGLDERSDVKKKRRPRVTGGKPYFKMITEAIKSYGNEATYKEINDYISAHFKEEVSQKKTWRNSVGGVLSSSPLFEAIPLPTDDSKRGRGALWRIKTSQKNESF